MNFSGILIGSEHPEALAEYYTRLFGEPSWNDGGYTGWMLGAGSVTVGPHSEVRGRSAHPGRMIWNLESTDVLADFARLKTAGAVVIAEPYTMDGAPPDSWIATFADPDDNYFQLLSPMDPSAM